MTILKELTNWNLKAELQKARTDLKIGDDAVKQEACKYILEIWSEIWDRNKINKDLNK